MDGYELTARKTLALCASVIIVAFFLVAWIVVGISMWLLSTAPDEVGLQAGSLVGPLTFLVAGAVGAVLAAGVLFWLARGWVRSVPIETDPSEPELSPVLVDAQAA